MGVTGRLRRAPQEISSHRARLGTVHTNPDTLIACSEKRFICLSFLDRSPVMSIRRCNCSGHSGVAVAPTQPVPPYIPPTRALLLHLSNFTPASAFAAPHLHALESRSTDMRLQWQDDATGGYLPPPAPVDPSSIHTHTPRSDHAVSSIMRLIGLDSSEQAAGVLRSTLLNDLRLTRGVHPSPAASYPRPFGRAHIEIATNHLALHELARGRIEASRATCGGGTNVTRSVFLQPQVAMTPHDDDGHLTSNAASPFLAIPRPPLQSHSSVPLLEPIQRSRYISAIVQHVKQRLGYLTPALADDDGDDQRPHILLLHIDAHSLLGQPASSQSAADLGRVALGFIDQLLAALMIQLEEPHAPDARTTSKESASSQTYPPIPPQIPPTRDAYTIAPLSADPHPLCHSSPQQSAELVVSTLSNRTPHLLWSILTCDESAIVPTVSPPSVTLRSRVLDAIRPIQSFQVQDGITDQRKDGSANKHKTKKQNKQHAIAYLERCIY